MLKPDNIAMAITDQSTHIRQGPLDPYFSGLRDTATDTEANIRRWEAILVNVEHRCRPIQVNNLVQFTSKPLLYALRPFDPCVKDVFQKLPARIGSGVCLIRRCHTCVMVTCTV